MKKLYIEKRFRNIFIILDIGILIFLALSLISIFVDTNIRVVLAVTRTAPLMLLGFLLLKLLFYGLFHNEGYYSVIKNGKIASYNYLNWKKNEVNLKEKLYYVIFTKMPRQSNISMEYIAVSNEKFEYSGKNFLNEADFKKITIMPLTQEVESFFSELDADIEELGYFDLNESKKDLRTKYTVKMTRLISAAGIILVILGLFLGTLFNYLARLSYDYKESDLRIGYGIFAVAVCLAILIEIWCFYRKILVDYSKDTFTIKYLFGKKKEVFYSECTGTYSNNDKLVIYTLTGKITINTLYRNVASFEETIRSKINK